MLCAQAHRLDGTGPGLLVPEKELERVRRWTEVHMRGYCEHAGIPYEGTLRTPSVPIQTCKKLSRAKVQRELTSVITS